MASKEIKSLPSMDHCPICQQTLTKPEALQCLHFCCKACIEDMHPATDGSEMGYVCPLCRKFTAKDQVKPMYFVQELKEVVESAKKKHMLCEKCKTEPPAWRCTDCKENYCGPCRKHHNGFSMLRNHVVEPINEKSYPILDRHIYCEYHSRQHVDLHCRDCHTLICMMCNQTAHKQHAAESIEDALKEAIPLVQESAEKLDHLINTTEDALYSSQHRVKELRIEYDAVDNEVDRRQKEALKEAEKDYNDVKHNVAMIRAKQMEEAMTHIQGLELTLQSQKNMQKLSDATLSTAQGTSLLHAIHTGLGKSLTGYVTTYAQPMAYADGCSAKFAVSTPLDKNIIGVVSEAPTGKHSLYIPRLLTNTTQFEVKLEKAITTPFTSTRFCKIAHEVWFAGYETNQIHICSLEGKVLTSLQFPDITKCRSLVQVSSKVVVAAANGLFLVDQSNKIEQLVDGEFCDVSVKGNTIFALDNGTGAIHILNQRPGEKSFTNQRQITIDNYNKHIFNTIQVTNADVYVAQDSTHCILQYSHKGEQLAIHGGSGGAVGQLQNPHLCGADAEGVVLIADFTNNRFQSLTPDGTWACVALNGVGQNPIRAVFSHNKLFVQSNGNYNIFQIFSMQ